MYNKIAVIGLGNTLRRDDGIGIAVLEFLLKFFKQDGVDYLNFGSASFDLLHKLRDYSVAVLIDGMDAGLKTAELKIFKLSEAKLPQDKLASSTHGLNLNTLFSLSEKLKLKAKIFVAGIQVEDVSFGEGLSEELQSNLEKITQEVAVFISKSK